MYQVTPIPAFNDNYIWSIEDLNNNNCILVDPGDATPVIEYLRRTGKTLSAVLLTHHHNDHIGGVSALQAKHPQLPIFGAKDPRIPATHAVKEGDTFTRGELNFSVLEIPGHTSSHIGFYTRDWLFCGDTLFSAGCGRLFEGTPQQMRQSLDKLCQLPDNTQIFCTHEYTQANVNFALAVEPDNRVLQQYASWVNAQRSADKPTLPSQLGKEKAINPFLRSHVPEVIATAKTRSQMSHLSQDDVFAEIRRWKDSF